jgi:CheY-specific phosphatase CheX
MPDAPDNVVILPVVTSLDCVPERVLEGAMGKLEGAVVIGRETGGAFYFASSLADGAEVLWLLEIARKRLIEIADA